MPDKDLSGKFLMVTLTREELMELPVDPPIEGNNSRFWLLGGTVDGQTANLGLWVRVSTIQDAEGETLPGLDKAVSLLLMPWGILQRSVLVERKPDKIEFPLGFRSGSR
ncbi:MAG TPA: hypothetical protein VMS64_04595 [Candidatus Methylomirabilis sp.]|nr:hypothetical protein [Candidatus Methylomirabilis sp.]